MDFGARGGQVEWLGMAWHGMVLGSRKVRAGQRERGRERERKRGRLWISRERG